MAQILCFGVGAVFMAAGGLAMVLHPDGNGIHLCTQGHVWLAAGVIMTRRM